MPRTSRTPGVRITPTHRCECCAGSSTEIQNLRASSEGEMRRIGGHGGTDAFPAIVLRGKGAPLDARGALAAGRSKAATLARASMVQNLSKSRVKKRDEVPP